MQTLYVTNDIDYFVKLRALYIDNGLVFHIGGMRSFITMRKRLRENQDLVYAHKDVFQLFINLNIDLEGTLLQIIQEALLHPIYMPELLKSFEHSIMTFSQEDTIIELSTFVISNDPKTLLMNFEHYIKNCCLFLQQSKD